MSRDEREGHQHTVAFFLGWRLPCEDRVMDGNWAAFDEPPVVEWNRERDSVRVLAGCFCRVEMPVVETWP